MFVVDLYLDETNCTLGVGMTQKKEFFKYGERVHK